MLLLLIIVVLARSEQPPPNSAAITFFEGFLEGVAQQVTGTCYSDFEDAYNYAMDAFGRFKTAFKMGDVQSAYTGFSDLARCFKDVKSALKACQGIETFIKDLEIVAGEIAAGDWLQIGLEEAWHILWHGIDMYRDVKGAVESYESGNVKQMGFDLGKLSAELIEGAVR